MKKYIVIAFLIAPLQLVAQSNTYTLFPDSNAVWHVLSQACCASNCSGPPFPSPVFIDYDYTFFILGDTVINSINYHKLYKSGSIHEYCMLNGSINNWNFVNNVYEGAFRQDTVLRKVYFVYSMSTGECTLMDFNLAVGDTIKEDCSWFSSCAIVSGIDSILIGNGYRKKFNLATQGFPYFIIEGIGSTAGLFEPLCPFEYGGNLICFSQNGQTLFPDTVTSCNNLTGTSDNTLNYTQTIKPNPFSLTATVELDWAVEKGTWIVYDAYGRPVKSGNFTGNQFQMDSNELHSGMHFLYIQSGDIQRTLKFVFY